MSITSSGSSETRSASEMTSSAFESSALRLARAKESAHSRLAEIGVPNLLGRVEPVQTAQAIAPVAARAWCAAIADPEPSRAGVDQEPRAPFCVSFQLEEVVASTERTEMPPNDGVAACDRGIPRREGRGEEVVRHGDAAPTMHGSPVGMALPRLSSSRSRVRRSSHQPKPPVAPPTSRTRDCHRAHRERPCSR